MKEIIAISNQKGGVGKSTTANALGAGLQKKGFKVLYVDMDAQANLSYSMGVTAPQISSLNVLAEQASAKDAIVKTAQGDLIPASPALAAADLMLTDTGKEYKLKEALEPILDDYDYMILDCPPALGVLTANALTACDSVIIPVQADVFSLQGVGQLLQTINTVKKYCNPNIRIKGLLATRYNARTVMSRDMTEMLEETARQLGTSLYKVKIRECTALKEAQANQEDIFTYAPTSNAASDYTDFLNEVLAQ